MKYLKIFMLLSCIFMILILTKNTYAKYKDKIIGSTDISVASWNIKVNNEVIANKTVLQGSIVPVLEGNQYTMNNVLAPNSTGYYDIYINANDVQVTFDYKLIPTIDSNSVVTDLIVTGYSIDNGSIETFDGEITGTILYAETSKRIRVYIKWDDEGSMDNVADTNASFIENGKAIINNDISFTQKK